MVIGVDHINRCHLGRIIRYDTVSKLKWGVDIRTHGIAVVVEKLLSTDWEDAEEGGVPGFYEETDCSVRLSAQHRCRMC